MRKLAEEIYTKLSGVGDTYLNMLDRGLDTSGLLIVYELNESGAYDTLDRKNYANDLELTVKLLHPDPLQLLTVAGQVKGLFVNQALAHCRDLRYRNSVPIFWDAELQTNQYTLLFEVFGDGTENQLIDILLNLFWPVDAALTQTVEIGDEEAGEYSGHVLTNVASAAYKVNGLAVAFPFAVVAGDTLEVTITLTDATLSAKIEMEGKQ
jgi:hypothetical protein